MKVIEGVGEMQAVSIAARSDKKSIVLVPTMGFLHEGHRELLRRGRPEGDLLVLSIFVNPAQFGPKEDLSAYPRDLLKDLEMARGEGVDVVFTPKAADIYPEGFQTFVDVEGLSQYLCGASRPGHFRGVATVVLKLFNIVMPDKAVFGRKDFQQLAIIERMVKDLNLPLKVIGVDTVREADGLALSSRNSYLDKEERRAAKCVPESVRAAKEEFAAGVRDSRAIVEKVKKIIEKEPLAVIDYIRVCHRETLRELDTIENSAMLFLAVKIGRARLIDNCLLA